MQYDYVEITRDVINGVDESSSRRTVTPIEGNSTVETKVVGGA